ncbi:MAG: response regulator [Lachnospiraceae bacterium]|nr:response regulator [Lachnospiraceae bacterium]
MRMARFRACVLLLSDGTFAGYEVTAVSDGLEGINAFHEQSFDLVLLDIMLPKIDGYTVCEMIRQESQIPIILLTALDAEDDQIKGFDRYHVRHDSL